VFRDVVYYEHVFLYQKVEDTNNKTNNPNILYQNPFTKDQPILSQSSQIIFVSIASCDNVEDNSNSDHESNIEVPEEICFHIDQNLNEAHEIIQSTQMSTRTKKPHEYLKDYHYNLNVSNTFSKVKHPLN